MLSLRSQAARFWCGGCAAEVPGPLLLHGGEDEAVRQAPMDGGDEVHRWLFDLFNKKVRKSRLCW